MNSLRKWRSKKFSKIVKSCWSAHSHRDFLNTGKVCVCVHVSVCAHVHRNDSSCTSLLEPCHTGGISVENETLQGLDFNIFQLHPFKSQTIQITDSEIAHITSHCPHLAAHPASARKVCQPETLCLCAFNVPLSEMSTSASNLLSVFRYQSSESPNDRKF